MAVAPLAGMSVIVAASGIAGGYAGRLLADAGASVVKIVGPADVPADPLFHFLHRDQERRVGRVVEDVGDLLCRADIVIVGQDELGRAVLARPRPLPQVVVAITPYGLTGPWAGRPSSELVLQAESGSLALRGRPSEPPLMAGGRTTEWIAGAYAAAAATAAAIAAEASGRGDLVDVSVFEVAHLTGTVYVPLKYELQGRPPVKTPGRLIEPVEIHPSADGWVGFTTNSAQQFQDFLVLIDRADLLADEMLMSSAGRIARIDEWKPIVDAWTSVRATAEIVDQAGELRIPCAPVLNAETMTSLPHFVDRRVFRRSPEGYVYPRPAWRLDGHDPGDGAPLPDEQPAGSMAGLEGIRVVDMTAWWAGPTATHLLAALGADVIHVESAGRPDGVRMTGGTLGPHETWWERGPIFLSVNTNKRGLTLDLSRSEGLEAFERLVSTADLLIENFTPRVWDNLGISWNRLQELNPRLSVVRLPAFGLDGPWRDRPGFAQTMEQVSGLAWLTGWTDGQPHNQRGPCDPNGGVHAAFAALCALRARVHDGRGHHVEVPFVEVALNSATEQLVTYSASGVLLSRDGNRASHAAPQGVYPCLGDDRWIAISVEHDEQWCGLGRALGEPLWADDPRLKSVEGRRTAHDELDAHLTAWTSRQTAEVAVDALLAQGVPAGQVREARVTGDHEQLVARHFFEVIDHPVVGRQPVASLPFRFESVSSWLRTPAPTLGQHNAEILHELGYSDDEVESMQVAGVIGTRPSGLD